MALRKYTNPRELDLSPGLQDVLRRNGMQAHMSMQPNGQIQLIVLGHDSPAISYNLNDRQVEDLMGWGSNYVNKKAYNTFTSIVKNDFYMPDNFVSARNAFGRVSMGLHGYRMGAGEYGIPYYRPFSRSSRGWGGDFIGWEPGWNMRRVGGRTFMAGGGVMTPVRPDGRVKPGELNAGGYGFYYKGQQQTTRQDVLDNIIADDRIQPVKASPRPQGQAIPFSEAINIHSEVTNPFTPEKFQEVLASHGVVIDAEKKTLTIQSAQVPIDLRYDLNDEELQTLTAEGLGYPNGKTVEERLAVINKRIMEETPDFANSITMEMLESKNLVDLDLTFEARQSPQIAAFFDQQELYAEQQRLMAERNEAQQYMKERSARIAADPTAIDGLTIRDILGNRGWFQPVNNGREMVVGEIRVDKASVLENIRVYETNAALAETANNFQFNQFRNYMNDSEDKGNAISIDADGKCEAVVEDLDGQLRTVTWQLDPATYEKLNTSGLESLSFEHRMEILKESYLNAAVASYSSDNLSLRDPDYDLDTEKERHLRDIYAEYWDKTYQKPITAEFDRRMTPEQYIEKPREEQEESYVMSALINGEVVTHTISKKDYDKFLALDDAHRLKLFDKVFDEVAIKHADGNSHYDDMYLDRDGHVMLHDGLDADYATSNRVDGATLQDFKQHKGFYREIAHGREVEVGEIKVDKEVDGKYKMTAVIDGQSVTHEISQKQYDKFLAVDDYQRMKLFDKIFDEVDIKTRPGEGTNLGAAILAALVATGELLSDPLMHHGPGPEIYKSRMPGTVYYKPGVVSPAEVAAANFENLDRPSRPDYSEGRGMGM
jgi:hypothetical protein